MRKILELIVIALIILAPATMLAQSRNDLIGRRNLHVNGEPPWKQYLELKSNGAFEYYSEAWGQKIRESGTWKFEAKTKKVVVTVTRSNGKAVNVRSTFTYHSSGALVYDNNPIESYCKQDHPHQAVVTGTAVTSGSMSTPGTSGSLSAKERAYVKQLQKKKDATKNFTVEYAEGKYLVTMEVGGKKARDAVLPYLKAKGVVNAEKRLDKDILIFPYCDL